MINIILSWISNITIKRSRSFWIAFTLLIITALSMRISSSCLLTVDTPKAIVDLELAFDQVTAIAIKESWSSRQCIGKLSISSNAKEAAIINIFMDFAFIATYSWFFIVLIVLTQAKGSLEVDKLSMLGCYSSLAAGLLDVIENIFMLMFLIVGEINSLWFAIPATFKFVTIVLLIFFVIIRLVTSLFFNKTT